MKLNLTHVVGALSLGALTLAGCKSKEPAPEPAATEEATTAPAAGEKTCGAKEGEGEAEGEAGEHKCAGGECGGGK